MADSTKAAHFVGGLHNAMSWERRRNGRLYYYRAWSVKGKAVTNAPASTDRKHLPPPQITWAMLGLIRYRVQKRWAWNALKERVPLAFKDDSG